MRVRTFCSSVLCLVAPIGAAAQQAQFEGMDPLQWAGEPHARLSYEVSMSAEKLSERGVEYRFRCIAGGAPDSEWQEDSAYTLTGLTAQTDYTFVAEARDRETGTPLRAPSHAVSVTTREANRFDGIVANEAELVPLLLNGDKDNRVNILIVNRWRAGERDPYNRPEMRDTFLRHARDVIETALVHGTAKTQEPFATQRNLYNVYALWWPGVPAWNPEAYDKGEWAGHWAVYNELRARLFLPWRHPGRGWVTHLAMANSRGGGGGAGLLLDQRVGDAMIEGNEIEAFFHEFSHTALRLGDTYIGWGCWGRADESTNTTLVFQREKVKWRAWIDPGTPVPTPYGREHLRDIGLFEGGTHRPAYIFRATPVCTMGVNQFAEHVCDVCIQEAAQRAYDFVDPIENPSPFREELTLERPGRATFSIRRVKPDPDTQHVEWRLNGALVGESVDSVEVGLGALADYELACSLVDRTPLIREDPPFARFPRAERSWRVRNLKPTSTASPLSITLEPRPPSVRGVNDGALTARVTGGVPPYSWAWSNGGTEPTIAGLDAGAYSVRIVDAEFRYADAECTLERKVTLAVDTRSRLLEGGWRVEAAVAGDAPETVDIAWSTGAKGPVVAGLPDGDYTYTITHASGDVIKGTVSLIAPETPLSASVKALAPSTGENNGQVLLGVKGGRTPCRVEWADAPATGVLERLFLPPGDYAATVRDANSTAVDVAVTIADEPAFILARPVFEPGRPGEVHIANARDEFQYLWYAEDWPTYILHEPRGVYEGTFTSKDGRVFEASGAVIPNTDGKWANDATVDPENHRGNNDYGSWVRLDAFLGGRRALPMTLRLGTDHKGEARVPVAISGQTTCSATPTEITGEGNWKGVAERGHMTVEGEGPDGGRFDLLYTARHENVSRPVHIGPEFAPPCSGNYYVAAQDVRTGAISANRVGVALTVGPATPEAQPLTPDKAATGKLLLWLDAADVDGDGVEDSPVWERGSLLGMRGKPGGFQATSFIIYDPNYANGRPVANWQWMWIQALEKPVVGYQTLFMVYRDHELSQTGTGPWKGLDAYLWDLRGNQETLGRIAPQFRDGRAWLDGEPVKPYATPAPLEWHVATFELAAPGDRPIDRTDEFWEGAVAECVMMDGVLAEPERRGIETYLRRKWVSEVHVGPAPAVADPAQ
jgi:hypothetical protein